LGDILGVFKAYTTRVGNGPFPTEFSRVDSGNMTAAAAKELENFVRETGGEYGVTTGRPRRCGFLDLVALRYACRVNSISSLVLTHLDVYDTLSEVYVAASYSIDGKESATFPASIPALEKARPVLKRFAGWKQSIANCKNFADLPANAKAYIEFIEDYCGTKVGIVSVGSGREQTLVR
jgi:adenylosuccinate synthase